MFTQGQALVCIGKIGWINYYSGEVNDYGPAYMEDVTCDGAADDIFIYLVEYPKIDADGERAAFHKREFRPKPGASKITAALTRHFVQTKETLDIKVKELEPV